MFVFKLACFLPLIFAASAQCSMLFAYDISEPDTQHYDVEWISYRMQLSDSSENVDIRHYNLSERIEFNLDFDSQVVNFYYGSTGGESTEIASFELAGNPAAHIELFGSLDMLFNVYFYDSYSLYRSVIQYDLDTNSSWEWNEAIGPTTSLSTVGGFSSVSAGSGDIRVNASPVPEPNLLYLGALCFILNLIFNQNRL